MRSRYSHLKMLCLVNFGLMPAILFFTSYVHGMQNPASIVSADFNNDSIADIAFLNIDKTETEIKDITIVTLLGKGNGTFLPEIIGRHNSFLTSIEFCGDLNNDGIQDLIGNMGSSFLVYFGHGDGTFPDSRFYQIPRTIVDIADFNHDGWKDIAALGASNLYISLNKGDGTFGPETDYLVWNSPKAVADGDFDADGNIDLAVVNAMSNDVCVFFGIGDGSFTDQISHPARYSVGKYPTSITSADFDGDGKDDLAIANTGRSPDYNNIVSILLEAGDRTFLPHVEHTVGTGPCAITALDFNGDKKIDIAVVNRGGNDVSILTGMGDGNFDVEKRCAVGKGPNSMTSADFNGDGADDLAVTNYDDKSISIILGSSSGQPIVVPTSAPSPTPTLFEKPQVLLDTEYRSYHSGAPLMVNWRLFQGLKSYLVDAYLGVQLPNGKIYIYNGKELKKKASPIVKSIVMNGSSSGSLGPFSIPQDSPKGSYILYAVLAVKGKTPWSQSNWVSNLASCGFSIQK